MTATNDARLQRAQAVAEHSTARSAIAAGAMKPLVELTAAEAVVLGLIEQGVRTFIGILGHGSTALADAIKDYAETGAVRFFGVRHETAAAHAATALSMVTGDIVAVVTSIGPGALHAFAGSLTAASNGSGVWHIYGDATTEAEGPNMQDLPGSVQGGWQRLTSSMGPSFSLHTPQSICHALQRGLTTTRHPYRPGPFFLMLPMNIQPARFELNLNRLPSTSAPAVAASTPARVGPAPCEAVTEAAGIVHNGHRVVIKVGHGGANHGPAIERLCELARAVAVLSPGSVGALEPGSPHNMAVGGSKGSLSGNFAMETADTLVVLGSRSVCQADCSRTGYPQVTRVININADIDAATNYNNTLALIGDIGATLEEVCAALKILPQPAELDRANSEAWLDECRAKREAWDQLIDQRCGEETVLDKREGRPLVTQPAALAAIERWARANGAIRFFDAGDVQANAFQIARDMRPDESFTDAGASYMGFATSALLAGALDDRVPYTLAVVGDGSFLMNPQALIDGVVHGARGAVVVLDNRRMGAISGLQRAQYGYDWATSDEARIDYVALGSAIDGVTAVSGDGGVDALTAALDAVQGAGGVGLVHVPVYFGDDPAGGFDAYGRWNVGPWVDDVQAIRHRLDL